MGECVCNVGEYPNQVYNFSGPSQLGSNSESARDHTTYGCDIIRTCLCLVMFFTPCLLLQQRISGIQSCTFHLLLHSFLLTFCFTFSSQKGDEK